jgi:hypothetical protein
MSVSCRLSASGQIRTSNEALAVHAINGFELQTARQPRTDRAPPIRPDLIAPALVTRVHSSIVMRGMEGERGGMSEGWRAGWMEGKSLSCIAGIVLESFYCLYGIVVFVL